MNEWVNNFEQLPHAFYYIYSSYNDSWNVHAYFAILKLDDSFLEVSIGIITFLSIMIKYKHTFVKKKIVGLKIIKEREAQSLVG